MGLFSAKSFLTPLIDKRALGVIVLSAVFFAVFRLSGGSVGTAPRAPIDHNVTPSQQLEDDFGQFDSAAPETEIGVVAPQKQPPAAKPRNLNRDDLLNDITGGSGRTENKAQDSQSGNRLDDIEKSLGLK